VRPRYLALKVSVRRVEVKRIDLHLDGVDPGLISVSQESPAHFRVPQPGRGDESERPPIASASSALSRQISSSLCAENSLLP